MRKTLVLFRNTIISLSAFALAFVVFLYIFYSVSEKRLDKQNLLLEKNKLVRVIQADTILSGTSAKSLNLLPLPQKHSVSEGSFILGGKVQFEADTLQDTIRYFLVHTAGLILESGKKTPRLFLSLSDSIPEQGYTLKINNDGITITFSNIQGLYYSMVTLKALNRNYEGKLPVAEIVDYPDLAVRGLFLELNREKLPAMETLLSLVEILADLKYNHLEVLMNSNHAGDSLFYDGQKIGILDSFCKARHIQLIPVLNSSIHKITQQTPMKIFRPVVFSGRLKIKQLIFAKTPEDSIKPQDHELLARMSDTVLPLFTSDMCRIHFNDHDNAGNESIYYENVAKTHDILLKYKKNMMMGAHQIFRKDEPLHTLPREIVLADHGYDPDYPFEKHSQILKSAGFSFVLCPGTASWNTITGQTNTMLANIGSAVLNGEKYDAEGIVLHDRCMEFSQYIPVSYPAYAVAGALSWNCKSMSNFPLVDFLNRNIFRDNRSIMGDLALDLGRYTQFEEFTSPEYTSTMFSLIMGLKDRLLISAVQSQMISDRINRMYKNDPEAGNSVLEKYDARHPFDYSGLLNYLDEKEALLNSTDLKTEDSSLVKDEFRNALKLIRIGAQLRYYIQISNKISPKEKTIRLSALRTLIAEYLNENKRLWTTRKITGDYGKSIAEINNLLQQIDREMAYTKESIIVRQFRRFKEKVITSATILSLRYF